MKTKFVLNASNIPSELCARLRCLRINSFAYVFVFLYVYTFLFFLKRSFQGIISCFKILIGSA